MAYMNQERKAELATGIKSVLKEYGVKGTIGVRNHSTLTVNIKSGAIDFDHFISRDAFSGSDGYIQVNPHWIDEHYEGVAKEFLSKLKDAMMVGNHDKSDVMTDYFNVGWYIDINIGNWNKPYKVAA